MYFATHITPSVHAGGSRLRVTTNTGLFDRMRPLLRQAERTPETNPLGTLHGCV